MMTLEETIELLFELN